MYETHGVSHTTRGTNVKRLIYIHLNCYFLSLPGVLSDRFLVKAIGSAYFQFGLLPGAGVPFLEKSCMKRMAGNIQNFQQMSRD